jgi:hypothetical protein
VQIPLNVMDAHYDSFQWKVLPVLAKNEIGVLEMKPMVPAHDVERDRSTRRTDASGREARKIRAVEDDPPLRRDVSKPPVAGMMKAWRVRVRS